MITELQRRDGGFVLVGVIWFLAIMTLLAAAAVLWVERSIDATESRRQALVTQIEERSLLARVQWLVATQGYTVAGLTVPGDPAGSSPQMDASILPVGGEIPLDGRAQCMSNGWCVALIDHAARLSLSSAEPRLLRNLLIGLGVRADQVPVMLAQWADYLHPGGAPQLGAAGDSGEWSAWKQPRRRPVRTVMEVFSLRSWQHWEEHLLRAGWAELVTADESSLNVNTADVRVLSLAWRVPRMAVERLVVARQRQPITQPADLHILLGSSATRIPDDGWARLASASLSIRLFPAGAERGAEYEVNFRSEHRLLPPWQIQLKRSIELNEHDSIKVAGEVPSILSAPIVAGAR
jgi:hypothetical protein